MIILLAAQLFFGSCLPLSKMALAIMPPLLFVGARLTIGGVLLFSHAHLRSTGSRCTIAAILPSLLPTILLGIVLKDICKYWALSITNVTNIALLLATTPLWAAFFSRIILGELFSQRQIFALFLGVSSSTVLALVNTPRATSPWPTIVMLIAVLADAYSSVRLRRIAQTNNTPKNLLAGLRMMCGGLPLLVIALTEGNHGPIINIAHLPILLIAVTSGCVTHTLYLHLLKRYPTPLISLADLLGPLVATICGWVLLHEQPTRATLASGALVVIALYLFNRPSKSIRHVSGQQVILR